MKTANYTGANLSCTALYSKTTLIMNNIWVKFHMFLHLRKLPWALHSYTDQLFYQVLFSFSSYNHPNPSRVFYASVSPTVKSTSPDRRRDCGDHHAHYSVDRAMNFDYFDSDDDTNDDNCIDYDFDNYDDFHLKITWLNKAQNFRQKGPETSFFFNSFFRSSQQ